jgi:hypothetical protein
MSIRMTVLGLATGVLALAPLRSTDLPEQKLPVFGGSGGTAFSRDCGAGRVLTGLRYRAGLSLDAIGLLCRPVNADGSLGSESTVGTMVGGGGGTFGAKSCPVGSVVTGAYIDYGTWVDGLSVMCGSWSKSTRAFTKSSSSAFSFGRILAFNTAGVRSCEAVTQPAVAIRGRAASLVDALGFICDEP